MDKKVIDIPSENTQPELPKPTKRVKALKRLAKRKASRIDGTSSGGDGKNVLLSWTAQLQSGAFTAVSARQVFASLMTSLYQILTEGTKDLIVIHRFNALRLWNFKNFRIRMEYESW